MKATTRTVNAALRERGWDMVLRRDPSGYFYFTGDNANIRMAGVYVYRQSDLTLKQWLAEADERFEIPQDLTPQQEPHMPRLPEGKIAQLHRTLERYEAQLERASHPCVYGHLGCSLRDGGRCLDEAMSHIESLLYDEATLLKEDR